MAVNIFFDLPGGLRMPGIGLGTWESKDEKEVEVALNAALDAGYRHFDTAFVYENEKVIGRVLKSWFETGRVKREELFITTKLPIMAITPDKVEEYMKISLDNLQLDYVDLYLIHFAIYCVDLVPQPTDHIAVWKKMEEQVDAGRTKTIGLSNFNAKQIQNILDHSRIKPVNLQIEIHVDLQQKELVDFCHKNGITVVAYSPLGSPSYNKFLEKVGCPPKKLTNLMQNPVVTKIANKHKKTPTQVLLRHLLQRSIIVIPKSVTPSRIKENINVFDFKLDTEDMDQLASLEVGSAARVCDFGFVNGLKDHPEYPF